MFKWSAGPPSVHLSRKVNDYGTRRQNSLSPSVRFKWYKTPTSQRNKPVLLGLIYEWRWIIPTCRIEPYLVALTLCCTSETVVTLGIIIVVHWNVMFSFFFFYEFIKKKKKPLSSSPSLQFRDHKPGVIALQRTGQGRVTAVERVTHGHVGQRSILEIRNNDTPSTTVPVQWYASVGENSVRLERQQRTTIKTFEVREFERLEFSATRNAHSMSYHVSIRTRHTAWAEIALLCTVYTYAARPCCVVTVKTFVYTCRVPVEVQRFSPVT